MSIGNSLQWSSLPCILFYSLFCMSKAIRKAFRCTRTGAGLVVWESLFFTRYFRTNSNFSHPHFNSIRATPPRSFGHRTSPLFLSPHMSALYCLPYIITQLDRFGGLTSPPFWQQAPPLRFCELPASSSHQRVEKWE